jgi:N-ethylmaleimide reductase
MTRNRAAENFIPSSLAETYYKQRSSAGLIVTEGSQIMPEGLGYPNTPGIYSPEQVDGWKKITRSVHNAGGRIFLQLWHVGRVSHSLFQPNHQLPVAPSAIAIPGKTFTPQGLKPFETPRALEESEIPGIVAQYRLAAKNSLAAGFDGVEIHGANGYLLDQFLQSGTNTRTDAYGGSPENRARLLLEVTRAVIEIWGKDKVGVRLSPNGSFNSMTDANPAETFSYAIQELDKLGIVYLHLRQGTKDDIRHGRNPVDISIFRPLFHQTLILNDGFDRERAEQAIDSGAADLVAFGTLFISNPDLPKRLETNAPLNSPNPKTIYGGTEDGYINYPTLEEENAIR